MKKNNTLWRKSTLAPRICKYPAIQHKLTKELCIFGKKGQIWSYNDSTIMVLVYGAFVSKKIAKLLNVDIPAVTNKEEFIFHTSTNHVTEIARIIRASRAPGRQVSYAIEYESYTNQCDIS